MPQLSMKTWIRFLGWSTSFSSTCSGTSLVGVLIGKIRMTQKSAFLPTTCVTLEDHQRFSSTQQKTASMLIIKKSQIIPGNCAPMAFFVTRHIQPLRSCIIQISISAQTATDQDATSRKSALSTTATKNAARPKKCANSTKSRPRTRNITLT